MTEGELLDRQRQADGRASAVLDASTPGRLLDRLYEVVYAAWPDSRLRAVIVGDAAATRRDGIRFAAWAGVAGALTVLILRSWAAMPWPAAWIVPAAVGVVSSTVLVAAYWRWRR